MLIIFDRLFGTYAAERDDVKIRYGLVEPELSNNPIQIEFVEWRKLFKDLLAARSVRAMLGYLFMPPGWSPDGLHQTTEALRQHNRGTAVGSSICIVSGHAHKCICLRFHGEQSREKNKK
jgi:hypothetical protein